MAYRNKTYICFDADTDIHYYRLMTAWRANENQEFNFHNAHDLNNIWSQSNENTIKLRLRERLANTKLMIVLVGQNTRHQYKFVRWEIEWALENRVPIICVNLNMTNRPDGDLCPPLLRNRLAIHVPYERAKIARAMNKWPSSHEKHQREGKSGWYYYSD